MKEIKFRAWARIGEWDDDGEKMQFGMIDADSLSLDYKHPLLKDSLKDIPDDCYYMQYTGIKDENGKEIYEGDIIKFSTLSDYVMTGEVVYYDLKAAFEVNTHGEWWDTISFRRIKDIESIGNIYENPELLGG